MSTFSDKPLGSNPWCRAAFLAAVLTAVALTSTALAAPIPRSLPDTEELVLSGRSPQIVPVQLKQVLKYFDQRIRDAEAVRDQQWRPDFSSPEAYQKSVAVHRTNCRSMLGLNDSLADVRRAKSEELAADKICRIERLTIPFDASLSARGLLFVPKAAGKFPVVIACSDATVWPEAFAGVTGSSQSPPWLAELLARGAAVYVPQSIERLVDHPECQKINPRSRRQIIYRLGYLLGRSMPGLDVQEVGAAIDYLATRPDIDAQRIGMFGIGQGGMTALYTAAIDQRIAATSLVEYFRIRDGCWAEPADRRLFGVLLEFGDAELAALIAPRPLTIVQQPGATIPSSEVISEAKRARRFFDGLGVNDRLRVLSDPAGQDRLVRAAAVVADQLGLKATENDPVSVTARVTAEQADAARNRHFEEHLAYLQTLVDSSESVRAKRWGLLSSPQSDFGQTQTAMLKDYRSLVGEVPTGDTPLRPRTKLALITDKYTAYHVMLDVCEGVEVYGQLLIPRGADGRTPAVICQHGLNGIPDEVTGLDQTDDTVYHEFGRHLAEHGYVVFAPLILHHYPVEQVDQQVRKATAVGMMRLAMVVAKTERVIDFLQTLPCVDAERIGYYGLSYGGYSAIWSAPLIERLAAVVCSGDFNDRPQKLTADWTATSYFVLPYEDMYNWNLLNRYMYPELVAMTAPRPFCVEFAEHDTTTTPEWMAKAWGQTTAIRDHLGLTDRIEMVHFDGEHEIHGIRTFDFLDRRLRPSRTVGRDYEYDLRRTTLPSRHPLLTFHGGDPCLQHRLDGRPETHLRGRFWIPTGAKELRGMAIKLSRDGHPGTLEVRFGSAPGKDDLGVGTLACDGVLSLFEYFEPVRVDPQPVREGQLVYYEIRAGKGRLPEDHYRVFGPLPLGGKDWPADFGLSYRVLTDRPQDSLDGLDEEPTFHRIKQMARPYHTGVGAQRLRGKAAAADETAIDGDWAIRYVADSEGVIRTVAEDLQQFFAKRAGVSLELVEGVARRGSKGVSPSQKTPTPNPSPEDGGGGPENRPIPAPEDGGGGPENRPIPAPEDGGGGPENRPIPAPEDGGGGPENGPGPSAKDGGLGKGSKTIELVVSDEPGFLEAIDTEEGYRVVVAPSSIRVVGRTPRGVMRGIYYIEELMRFREAACLRHGTTDRNCKFRRRLSTIGGIVELGLAESSHPLPYVDGVLQQLSRHGFNAIWIIINVEDAALDSEVFPELNDPHAARRFERLRDVVDRAKRFGIDVFSYYTSNYNYPVPESFYEKRPDTRGTDWGNAMCTSHPDVQRYLEETTRKLFKGVPGLAGSIVIFDTEGFRSCAMGLKRTKCPRCKHRSAEEIVMEMLQIVDRGMKAGNPDTEMIAWSYRISREPWVNSAIGKLPDGAILQAGFSQGTRFERGGVEHVTPDYNITVVGPSEIFVEQYHIAREHGVPVIAKTESAASQECLGVPYIPCMGQWYERIAKISEFELDGLFGTYNHYGYTNSRPVDIMLWYSWTEAPEFDKLLDQIITRDFGRRTIPHIKRAWQHVTRAIRNYPYSNWVSRSAGGPIQKGPSQPLWLGEGTKTSNPWRAWQNDLNWTNPWGPKIVDDCFRMIEDEMVAALAELQQAREVVDPLKSPELEAEIRVIEMMRRSFHTMRNLIRWIPIRDAYNKTESAEERANLRKQLIAICEDEMMNAKAALVLAKADSRFGEVAQPMGARRGGLFNAPLIRFKIGQLEDVLYRKLDTNAP